MWIGPIHSVPPGFTTGHSPVKPIRVKSITGKQSTLFDSTYPYGLQTDTPMISADTVFFESSQAVALARLHQIEELAQNQEWTRAGMFVQWREDSVQDGEDGWYVFDALDVSEEMIFSAYAEPRIDLLLRARQKDYIRTFVDAKLQPNDDNLGGVTLAAYPAGIGGTIYPAGSAQLAGANGNIVVVENPTSIMQAGFSTPTDTMTKSRCQVTDENVNSSVSTEVFWKDHRNLNGYTRIQNDLLRYTLHTADSTSLIEVWNSAGAVWRTVGSIQYQTINTGPVLPLRSYSLITISPEEVVWEERRYDSNAISAIRVLNRIRRGSRVIETQVIAASGAGLTGTQSIALVNGPANYSSLTQATDQTGWGVNEAGAIAVPGFLDLTTAPNNATSDTTHLYYGNIVPAGTVTRFGILAGTQADGFYSTLAAYLNKWTGYNRMRVKQRILIG